MNKVKLTYFKSSGKFYDVAIYETDKAFPWEIYEEVRFWSAHHNYERPGRTSQFWIGYILVEPEGGAPALIDLCIRDEDENNSG